MISRSPSQIESREINELFLKKLIRGQTIGIGILTIMVAIGGIFDRSLLALLPLGGLAVIFGVAASLMLRKGLFSTSGYVFFIGTSIAISINVYTRGYQDASTIYYLWPILGAVSTLERRGGVVVLISSLLSYLALAIGQVSGYLNPPIPFDPEGGAFLTLGSFAIMFSLLAYLAWLSKQNTQQALKQAQQAAQKLQEINETLENRVAERTRNLELASEVGRSVSQVRTLDIMLQDACELIQKEFDLYYVQVYLTNPSRTALQLQAGTGEVGTQLRQRLHSLQLNTNSINGRAAIEKRSVVIADTTESATFHPNPLLPDTRAEMAIPLIVADKVVGVLDMQSRQPDVLNEEMLPAFEALAGQLAVAIQNANLASEAEQTRAELEAQARRLARTAWAEHLDAIHKPEQIGFVFDRQEIAPLADVAESQPPEDEKAITAPIGVTGEAFGSLVVELDDEARREQTLELVNIVARQVAQQLENLRLLESAERYRFEAEQAAHRQTREGWQKYIESRTKDSLAYLYDLQEVLPYNNGHEDGPALTLPLKAGDETIGKLSVLGLAPNDQEALELASTVAERLGAHIDNLRLFEETKQGQLEFDKRESQLAAVSEISTASSR